MKSDRTVIPTEKQLIAQVAQLLFGNHQRMAKQKEEEGVDEEDQSLAKDEIEAEDREGEEAEEDEDEDDRHEGTVTAFLSLP